MYLPKTDIKNSLSTLNYKVMQSTQANFNELPIITFEILDNNISLFLDNSISYQTIIIKIDLWSDDSITTSNMLNEVEGIMRKNGYKLEFSSDVPNVDKSIFHTTTRFTKKVG